jgi:hypothetical protein
MPVPKQQVVRFAVGSAPGPKARSWRLWVDRGKSDVYILARTLGAVKVSLHELGPARCALTKPWLRRTGFQAPAGRDWRLAEEWERPRPHPPGRFARPLTIIVPWDEVRDGEAPEDDGQITWVPPPPDGMSIHFDIVYIAADARLRCHPGGQTMGTILVGEVHLENGQRVFVTALARPMEDWLRRRVATLRGARVYDAQGNLVEQGAMFAFDTAPNPGAGDGTQVGFLLDVTRDPRETGLPLRAL